MSTVEIIIISGLVITTVATIITIKVLSESTDIFKNDDSYEK